MNSNRKGKVGERELAALLRSEGFESRRGRQFKGSVESPDVICDAFPLLHLESKRTERLELYSALEQAREDGMGKIPVVAHRRNDCNWVAILDFKDFLEIVRESSFHRPTPGYAEVTEKFMARVKS